MLFEEVLNKMGLRKISTSLFDQNQTQTLSFCIAALKDFADHVPDEAKSEILKLCGSPEYLQKTLEEQISTSTSMLFTDAKSSEIITALANVVGVVIVIIPSVPGLAMYPIIPKAVKISTDPMFFVSDSHGKILLPYS